MSALCQERTFPNLFDHLVSAPDERVRNVDPERLGGLEVDVKLDFRCLLDRKVRGLLTLEDAASINPGLSVRLPYIAAVAHQSAGHRKLAHAVDRWHRVFECEGGKLFCPSIEYRVGSDEEPTRPR